MKVLGMIRISNWHDFSLLQSLRRREGSAKESARDSAEFDTETEIFQERDIENQTKSVLSDIAKLSKNLDSVALRDAYGREVRGEFCPPSDFECSR